MDWLKISSCYLLVFLFSLSLTGMLRTYLLKKAILDIPNERSSHQRPTPRGGGMAIVMTFSLSILGLIWQHKIDFHLAWTLLGGGFMVALIGYCDDIFSIRARWRILLHLIAAVWAIYWLGVPPILHQLGVLLALLGIVWCINFYNFMDGIDGLAGSEGVFVAVSAGITLSYLGTGQITLVFGFLTFAIAGFTLWNWPPAKIFLGDVGSGYLGYVFAVLGLYTINIKLLPLSFWCVISAVFLWDSTFTLLYRIYDGKKWYSAHREHAYQQLIAHGFSHQFTTIAVSIINICFLLPLALAILHWPNQSLWFTSISFLLLATTWIHIKFNRLRHL